MSRMLHGFHVIFSTYGFWLPNDPRGSWSDWVRRWELVRFGKAAGTMPSPWGRNCWVVYVFDVPHMRQAIEYVERNPEREGKRRQRWSFVTPYAGGARGKPRR